jgi:hypothetical protein
VIYWGARARGQGEGVQGDQTLGPRMAKFEITVFIFTPPILFVSLGVAVTGLFICPILLVSAILMQPIPIIFGARQVMMNDTNNSDLWYQPSYDDQHQRYPPI